MILFADDRGKFETELFTPTDYDPEDPTSIMLSITPRPHPVHVALSAAEARSLAAQLMDLADADDAAREAH